MTDNGRIRLELGSDGTAAELDVGALAIDEEALRLVTGLDAGRWELARLLSAVFDDGLMLAVVALRPTGAAGHGEESVVGVLVRNGSPVVVDEALLSVEYDPAGGPRRVGVELYEGADSLPLRIAGDRVAADPGRTALAMRNGGVSGRGRLAIVRPD